MISESESLHQRARAFIEGAIRGGVTEAFDGLATDVARFQIAHVAAVSRLARARGLAPEALREAAQIPAVPTDVFRFTRVAAHPPEEDVAVFRTSGTTSGARGAHAFRTLATYDAAASAWGARFLLGTRGEMPHVKRSPDRGAGDGHDDVTAGAVDDAAAHRRDDITAGGREDERSKVRDDFTVISLTPPPDEAPDSSLVHMIALFARPQRGPVTYHLAGGALDRGGVERACEAARRRGDTALLFGTSFAFVHLLDGASGLDLRLPPDSRAMLTGGFKGRSREVAADELREAIVAMFGLRDAAVVGEYGMTELSSQLYEGTLVDARRAGEGVLSVGATTEHHGVRVPPVGDARARHGVFVAPPWVRVTAVDPATLAPLAEGEIGIARIVDLANVDSAVAVQTADRVRVRGADVELLGRLPGATPRGCSLAVEEILG